jgi:hypothetical protein
VWEQAKKVVQKPYCTEYTERDGKKECSKTEFKTETVTVAKCKTHEKKSYCLKRKSKCVAHKLMKRCHKRIPKIIITGPTKCEPGYKLIFVREHLHIKRICIEVEGPPKPIEYKTCTIYNDPHIKGFKGGAYYNVHKEGDFLVAETEDKTFVVHNRFKRMDPKYAWTGIIGAAIKANGIDIVKIYPGSKIEINNKPFAAVEGANNDLPFGGSVQKQGKNVQVFGANGARALVTDHGKLINVMIYVDKNMTTCGLCDGVEKGVNDLPVSGLFEHRLHSEFVSEAVKLRKFSDVQAEKNAEIRCKAEKLSGNEFKACIFDMMQIKNPSLRKQMLQIEHNLKNEIAWGQTHAAPVKKVEKKAVKKVIKKQQKSHAKSNKSQVALIAEAKEFLKK